MKGPDLASLDIPRARKGEAAPAAVKEAPPQAASQDAPRHGSTHVLHGERGRGGGADTASDIRSFEEVPEAEVRSTVSVRLTLDMQERLRLAAFKSRRRKQEIIESALADYLAKRGY